MNRKRQKELRRLNKKPPTDQEDELFRFIKIVLGLIIFIIILFVFTKYVINDGDIKFPQKVESEGEVSYDNVVFGTMFNKTDEEYYVFVYDSKDSKADIHRTRVNNYKKSKKTPIYMLDLANKLNEGKEIPKDKIKAGEKELINPSLLKIKNGIIVEYIKDTEEIYQKLEIKES